MVGFLVVFFPIALMGFVLFMQRVEAPLRTVEGPREIEEFLDDASPEELDAFVREGTDSALRRFRRRLRKRRSQRERRNPGAASSRSQ